MNSECDDIKGKIADLISGILSESQVQTVEQHLEACSSCRDYARALKNEDGLLTEFFAQIDTDMTGRQERALNAIDRSFASEQSDIFSIWRIIMKSPITKLAAAAVIIIAVFIIINQSGTDGSSFVWADVAESFDSVPFVHITVYIGHDTPDKTKRIEIWKSVDSRVRVDEGNTVFFADLSNDKNKITIDRSTKKPVNDYENLPSFIWRLCSKKGRFSLDTLTKSFPSDVEGIIPLETTKTVASSDTVLFQARSKHITPEALKIWALRDSKLPIRFFVSPEQGYMDLFFDYSEQKDAAFFDPEAFRSQ